MIFDGNGNDGVSAGNGSDTVILGNGNDKVSLGNGSDGVETGDGNDTVTLGNGSQSEVIVGNGNDTVTVGTGSYNDVNLGSGTDTVTIRGLRTTTSTAGTGNETIYLGSGTYNTYSGQAHHTNTCHLPKPPSSATTARGGLLPRHHHQLHGGVAMRRRSLVGLFIAVLVAIGLAGATWAYFTSHGAGTGASVTGTLNPPTSVSAGPASGFTVPVQWNASSTGGSAVTPQGYYVTESNGSTTVPLVALTRRT